MEMEAKPLYSFGYGGFVYAKTGGYEYAGVTICTWKNI